MTSLQDLRLDYNLLTNLPDLNQNKTLKTLSVASNNIKVIDDLPVELEALIAIDNKVNRVMTCQRPSNTVVAQKFYYENPICNGRMPAARARARLACLSW